MGMDVNMDRGPRYCSWLTNALAVGVLSFAPAAAFGAPVYRCVDATGASKYTDSPVQASRCEVLALDAPASLIQPAQRLAQVALQTEEGPSSYFGDVTRETDITAHMQRVGQSLIVSTRINGTRDAKLIVDTGSSHTILSRDLAQELGLLSNLQAQPATLTTGAGPVRVQIVWVDTIRIADAEVHDNLVVVHDMPDLPPGVDGVLGLSFLSHFQVILDTASGELRLRRHADASPTFF